MCNWKNGSEYLIVSVMWVGIFIFGLVWKCICYIFDVAHNNGPANELSNHSNLVLLIWNSALMNLTTPTSWATSEKKHCSTLMAPESIFYNTKLWGGKVNCRDKAEKIHQREKNAKERRGMFQKNPHSTHMLPVNKSNIVPPFKYSWSCLVEEQS